ncbi:cancer/testis antigen family 45 member A6-like [Eulemur rufifrons]|uniref:cancer/testis antigen family 45 member A6-like n=1 Tax=Eulemur rufifrons TaxID=859984 RepID=UPI003741F0FA
MAGDGFAANQLNSLFDFTSLSRYGLHHKPDSNALGGGIITSNLSGDDPKVTEMSAMPKSPEEINVDIRHQLMKEKYERIFIFLERMQGPLDVRKRFVECIIKEATSGSEVKNSGIKENSVSSSVFQHGESGQQRYDWERRHIRMSDQGSHLPTSWVELILSQQAGSFSGPLNDDRRDI